jgi:hypothetical protein
MQFVASRTRPGLKGRFRSASISRRSHFREAATSLAKPRDIPPRRLVTDRKEPARRHRQPSVPFTDATRDAVGFWVASSRFLTSLATEWRERFGCAFQMESASFCQRRHCAALVAMARELVCFIAVR